MKYLIFCLVLICAKGQCLEVPFSEKTAADYYRSAELIIIGTKVGGSLDYSTYTSMASKLEIKDEKILREKWKTLNIVPDDFLILKVYKGEVKENEIIELDQSANTDHLDVTETAVVFVRDGGVVGWCDSFDLRNFSAAEVKKLISSDTKEMIDYLIKEKKNSCLNPATIRFDSK